MSQQIEKPGYKQSALGLIPEDWEIFRLDHVIKLINGKAFKPEDWDNSGLPIIRIQNLNNSDTEFNYYNKPVEERYHVNAGDILFAWSGTKGVSFGARIWSKGLAVLNQHIFKVVPRDNKIIPEYAYLILKKVQNIIESKAHGFKASFVHVKKHDLDKTLLPIPGLSEQKSTITLLNTWDRAINTVTNLIEKQEARRKWVVQSLLTGNKRLKGFNDGWNEYRLGELGETYNGLSGKSKDDFGEGFPYITYMNVFANPQINMNEFGLVKIGLSEKQNKVKYGDVLFTVSSETANEVGMAAILLKEVQNLYLNSFCFGFRLNDFQTILPVYTQFLFRSDQFRSDVELLAQGSTRFNISKSGIKKIQVKLPSLEEQAAIAGILQAADKELFLLRQKLVKIKKQKEGLMQMLLTGSRRIKL